ncbi:MAG: bifunctional serine/threonine-protein kinase/formylglycine-generating enzyme family protein [Planctomycetota bacterium]
MNHRTNDRRDRVALEFLLLYRSDEEAGRRRSLASYLELFDGDEELIASEYLQLQQGYASHSAATHSGTSNGAPPGLPSALGDEPRYLTGPRVGSGGMGDVHRGHDRLLDRHVAIKYPKRSAPSADRRAFLLREAVTAARLDHPNIPPVYDLGVDETNRPFLVMRLVQGRPLDAALADNETPRALQHWLALFQQICLAIDYAHHRGILHLDLKPANVMLGEYGEMQIIDWGLSSIAIDGRTDTEGVRGTPGYMAPEQLQGKRVTTATDTYALGLILFEICTGQAAFHRRDRKKALAASFSQGEAWEATPPPLREIIHRALQRVPKQRYQSGRALADDVGLFLQGVRERERRQLAARKAVELATAEQARRQQALAEAAALAEQLAQHPVETWDSLAAKRPLWQLEDAIDSEQLTAERALEDATSHLLEAFRQAPDDPEVIAEWASLCWERFQAAELASDRFQCTYFERELRALQLPHYDDLLRGEGTLQIDCKPRPQRITLHRIEERQRRLRPVQARDLVASPLPDGVIAHGSWQLTLERDGYRTLVAPVHVHRGERVRVRWRLRREHEIGAEFQLIPAGSFTIGGDAATLQSLPRARRHVAEFCMARFPVTFSEYSEFLRDLPRTQATKRLPREAGHGAPHPFIDADTLRVPGRRSFAQRWPVFGVSWSDATAYARWRSSRDNKRYRLPSDAEWEKAARGPDRRIFPWGNRYDARFCKNLGSTPARTQPERVGKYPADTSPYGVRDMAGGVREWCRSWFSQTNNQRLVRGGGWNQTPIGSHCAYRLPCPPHLVYPFIGFRLTHSCK